MKRIAAVVVALAIVAAVVLLVHRAGPERSLAGELADERFSGLVEGLPKSLEVSVEGVGADGFIDPVYTCDGADRPPRVAVTGIPGGVSHVVLIMYDPDAPGGTFIHWLAVEPVRGSQAVFPGLAMVEGLNGFGRLGYGGPCPPRGHGVHRYFFLVLALSGDPQLSPGYRLGDLLDAAKDKLVAWGYSVGKYSR